MVYSRQFCSDCLCDPCSDILCVCDSWLHKHFDHVGLLVGEYDGVPISNDPLYGLLLRMLTNPASGLMSKVRGLMLLHHLPKQFSEPQSQSELWDRLATLGLLKSVDIVLKTLDEALLTEVQDWSDAMKLHVCTSTSLIVDGAVPPDDDLRALLASRIRLIVQALLASFTEAKLEALMVSTSIKRDVLDNVMKRQRALIKNARQGVPSDPIKDFELEIEAVGHAGSTLGMVGKEQQYEVNHRNGQLEAKDAQIRTLKNELIRMRKFNEELEKSQANSVGSALAAEQKAAAESAVAAAKTAVADAEASGDGKALAVARQALGAAEAMRKEAAKAAAEAESCSGNHFKAQHEKFAKEKGSLQAELAQVKAKGAQQLKYQAAKYEKQIENLQKGPAAAEQVAQLRQWKQLQNQERQSALREAKSSEAKASTDADAVRGELAELAGEEVAVLAEWLASSDEAASRAEGAVRHAQGAEAEAEAEASAIEAALCGLGGSGAGALAMKLNAANEAAKGARKAMQAAGKQGAEAAAKALRSGSGNQEARMKASMDASEGARQAVAEAKQAEAEATKQAGSIRGQLVGMAGEKGAAMADKLSRARQAASGARRAVKRSVGAAARLTKEAEEVRMQLAEAAGGEGAGLVDKLNGATKNLQRAQEVLRVCLLYCVCSSDLSTL